MTPKNRITHPHDPARDLTKRELISAIALAGLLAHEDVLDGEFEAVAERAVDAADAVIHDLSKTSDADGR
jgi:hypothetical protein